MFTETVCSLRLKLQYIIFIIIFIIIGIHESLPKFINLRRNGANYFSFFSIVQVSQYQQLQIYVCSLVLMCKINAKWVLLF